jgi:hypothetical protein
MAGKKYALQFRRFTVCRWGSVCKERKKIQQGLKPNTIPVHVTKWQHNVGTINT